MEDLYEKNILFDEVSHQYKVASILASINVGNNNLLLEMFWPIIPNNYKLSNDN